MVGVTIDSGPIGLTNDSINTPREKWPDLVEFRREYIRLQFGYDCRSIVDWLHDAERMWKSLGYDDLDDMVRKGLGVNPEDVTLVVSWLQRYRPQQPVGLPEALGKALRDKAGNPTGKNQYSEPRNSDNCQNSSQDSTREKTLGEIGGNSSEYLTTVIARDHPAIYNAMLQGKYRSVRQAAIEAGIVTPSTRYSLPDDPCAAGRYLAQRVDREWFDTLIDAYYKAIEG